MYASIRKFITILFMGLCISIVTPAQAEEQATQPLSQAALEAVPLALEGYDVVTYFIAPTPLKGSKIHQAVYGEKRYLFVSAENQAKFSANPERYLPEFDEYCGCAASEGELVDADPTVFKIVDGKLVLFENQIALSDWIENESVRYKKAQNFWKYEDEYNADSRLRKNTTVRLFTF